MRKTVSIILAAVLAALLPLGALYASERDAEDVLVYGYYFENDEDFSVWTNIDADGDGEAFQLYPLAGDVYCYEGRGFVLSYSYDAAPLTPDNWLISPAVMIPAGGAQLSVYIGGYGNYPQEHFAIYAGASPSLDDMVEILPETLTTAAYVCRTVDLSAFAGSEVFIAVRHFNCTDQNFLRVDKFEIWGAQEQDDPYAIHEVYVDGWGTPEAGVAGIEHMFLTTPDGAPYSIVYGGWRDETEQQQMWNASHVFIPGHAYSEGCQIWAASGYYFADDCVFYADGSTDILDMQWCYVDETDNTICYMNSLETVCGQLNAMPGDVDGNDTVNIADAVLALRYAMGLTDSLPCFENADMDGNGSVGMTDAVTILRLAMGLS